MRLGIQPRPLLRRVRSAKVVPSSFRAVGCSVPTHIRYRRDSPTGASHRACRRTAPGIGGYRRLAREVVPLVRIFLSTIPCAEERPDDIYIRLLWPQLLQAPPVRPLAVRLVFAQRHRLLLFAAVVFFDPHCPFARLFVMLFLLLDPSVALVVVL